MKRRWLWVPALAAAVLLVRARPHKEHRFDDLFRRYGRGLPLSFLRTLAMHESGSDPSAATGPARGLLQVVESVRRGYNRRFGTAYSRRDLLDPAVNVEIATELLARIAERFLALHPRAGAGWHDPRFVQLVVFGWNAGYSEASGVGYVLGELERRRAPIDIDAVHRAASELPRASRHLRNPRKVRFAKRVTADYFQEIIA